MFEWIATALEGGMTLTLLVSGASLVAVMVPLHRGAKVGLTALRATRRMDAQQIERELQPGHRARPSVVVQTLQVLRSAAKDARASGDPVVFTIDACRQCVQNDYDTRYAAKISMFANVLPPLGFIGTTTGLLILFLSMRVESEALELGALALALTSSIFALIGFAFLEALRIRLYGRVIDRLDDAVSYFSKSARAESKAAAGKAAASATAG